MNDIISLLDSAPSGLQAQRECDVCKGTKLYCSLCQQSERHQQCVEEPCLHCKATGLITRDLTQREAIEWVKTIATYHTTMDYCLPVNGERIIVKEG